EQLATLSAEQLALMEGIVNKAGEASERTRRKSSLLIMNLPKGITRTQIEAAFLLLKFPAVSGVSRVGRAQKGRLQPMRIFFTEEITADLFRSAEGKIFLVGTHYPLVRDKTALFRM
ncbi:hypothetical protein Ciccas_013763, partial [Cichlidogyrus casuarinus]